MEISHECCRLCLSTTEFNISLFSSYCQKTNMLNKILACLKLSIEQTDNLTLICYKCADNIERYYDFLMNVKKSQSKITEFDSRRILSVEPRNVNRRHKMPYVGENVINADYTLSVFDIFNNEDKQKQETRPSSPLFSYFATPNVFVRDRERENSRKTPCYVPKTKEVRKEPQKSCKKSRHYSRDLFESQSQDVDEVDMRSTDWKLTPDESLMRRLREECFGRSDF